MNDARFSHTSMMLGNGKILVIGGWHGGPLKSVELYDPSTGLWTNTGNMNNPRYNHGISLLTNGKVLVNGGWN